MALPSPAYLGSLSLGGSPTVRNRGFEEPALDGGAFAYAPSLAGWTFGAKAGVAHGSSAFLTTSFDGMQAVASLEEAMDVAGHDGDELCIIGGGELYALALPWATHMRLTFVDTEVEGADAFFPRFDVRAWRETAREAHPADAAHAVAFAFVDYART